MSKEVFNSLLAWANKAESILDRSKIPTDEAERISMWYNIYKTNRPDYTEGGTKQATLTDEEKKQFSQKMVDMEKKYAGTLKMFGQGNQKKNIQYAVDKGSGDFAYFMRPIRDKEQEKGGGDSRITLSIDPKKADQAFQALAGYLSLMKDSEVGKSIKSLKLLGPNYQGDRTDSSIIYLDTTDSSVVKDLANDIKAILDSKDIKMYDHTPYGMEKVETGFSFSQRGPYSSSHGMARSKVIDDTVMNYIANSKLSMEDALRHALVINGYNPDDASRLDKNNYIKHFDTIEKKVRMKKFILEGMLEKDHEAIAIYKNDREDFQYELNALAGYMKNPLMSKEDKIKQALINGAYKKFQILFGKDDTSKKWVEDFVTSKYEEAVLQDILDRLRICEDPTKEVANLVKGDVALLNQLQGKKNLKEMIVLLVNKIEDEQKKQIDLKKKNLKPHGAIAPELAKGDKQKDDTDKAVSDGDKIKKRNSKKHLKK